MMHACLGISSVSWASQSQNVNLESGSGSHAQQTAKIMIGYEDLLQAAPCKLTVVVGDVTSTMACAITAQKLCIPVAHVEGGIRSGDWTMPEEINRLATDAVTNWFFTTSRFANENLRRSGVSDERIFFVGNTMIDTLLQNIDRLRPPAFWHDTGLAAKGYFVLTLHRPSNVDAPATLGKWLERHRETHLRPSRHLCGSSAHREEPERLGRPAYEFPLRRTPSLFRIQLSGSALDRSNNELWRDHGGSDSHGRAVFDTPRYDGASRDRRDRYK